MNNEKIEYLKMVQEVIARMSTTSSVVKGFSITFIVAITTVLCGDFIENNIFWVFFIPLLTLVFVDVYYLSLERKYRKLYENVRADIQQIDFSLRLNKNCEDINTSFKNCLLSKSILVFYVPIIAMYIIVWIFGGV